MSSLKVKYAFLTNESDEPEAIENFIAGYELAGGEWNGTIDTDDNINQTAFTQDYVDEQINSGYDLLIRNTATNLSQQSNVISTAIKRGMLPVVPAASNAYRDPSLTTTKKLYSGVFCGSGIREEGNSTSYPCMFFDIAPSEQPVEIRDVRQCGTEYTISHIYRYDANTLFIKLSGVSDVRDIGMIEQGIPMYISQAITGTNISPLPTGVIYSNNIIFEPTYFSISHTTSAGTMGAFQAVTTGKVKFGVTNYNGIDEGTSKVLIIGVGTDTGNGISLTGISGFAHNPNGAVRVAEFVNNDAYGDKCKIDYMLGAGTYEGGGTGIFATESYSTPFIAGQLAYIKDVTGFDWYDVIGNAIVTSSNYPTFDTYSGYGYIQIEDAIDPLIDKELQTPVLTLEEKQPGIITFNWNIIPYAKEYEIYFRGELIQTVNAHITRYYLSVASLGYYPYISNSKRNFVKVRAKRGDEYSDFSNQIEYDYYYSKGFLTKQYV